MTDSCDEFILIETANTDVSSDLDWTDYKQIQMKRENDIDSDFMGTDQSMRE